MRAAQTGNEQDVTMQAGRQRATLPLIRKFNEHSERLLKAALCAAFSLVSRPRLTLCPGVTRRLRNGGERTSSRRR
jgi:hypothetical protein